MERIEKAKIKAKIQSEKWDSKIKKLEQAQSDEEVRLQNERREKLKQQTQIDHEAYLLEQQRLQNQKEYEKSDMGRTERAKREGRESIQREIAMGLTPAEREFKHMDWKMRIDFKNMKAQGECKDLEDFLRKKKKQEKEREKRRRKLKGI